ncbi:MAG: cyclic nucleotide-binding domain-containing protein [Myxococcota bacterium]
MEASRPLSADPLGGSVAAVAFVQATSLFKDMPDAVMHLLYDKAEVVAFAPADVVIAQDATDTDLYIIFEGNVAVQKLVKGAWVHLADLERPAVFGELAALTEQPRAAAVVSTTDCRLIRVPGSTVRAIAEAAPKLGKRLAMLMSARGKDTERKLCI